MSKEVFAIRGLKAYLLIYISSPRSNEIRAALHMIAESLIALQPEVAWKVRVLPIVQMGIYPYRQDDWTPDFPEASVLHKFQGTWKMENQAQLQNVTAKGTKRPGRQGHLYRQAQ